MEPMEELTEETTSSMEALRSELDQFNVDDIIVGKDKRFTFSVTYTDYDSQKYEGSFQSRVPSIGDIIQIGILESSYYSGVTNRATLSPEIQNIAFMKATLKVLLVNWPSWFKIEELDNLALLESIYVQHALVVESFRKNSKIEFNKSSIKR